jgi:hypothetical protein
MQPESAAAEEGKESIEKLVVGRTRHRNAHTVMQPESAAAEEGKESIGK